jgi:hypothetical protein
MIAFGVSSLFFAILGVFVPSWGIFISGFSGFLAWMSAGKGVPLSAAAVIINLINIFLLSPSYMLVVGLESQLRTPDQNRILYIWMVVLFLQISAIGVHVVNFVVSTIDFEAIKSVFKKKKHSRAQPGSNEPTLQNDAGSTPSNNAELAPVGGGKPVGALSLETPDCQLYDKIEESGETFEPIRGGNKDLNDIPLEGSRPHDQLLRRNRTLLKVNAIVVFCICLAFLLVFLQPEAFSFLKYSNVFKAISKTFPEKDSNNAQKGRDQPAAASKTKRENITRSLPNSPKKLSEPTVSATPTIRHKPVGGEGYWYVIELKSGETILTQDAVITRGFVAVQSLAGKERRIDKKDLNSFKRIKI